VHVALVLEGGHGRCKAIFVQTTLFPAGLITPVRSYEVEHPARNWLHRLWLAVAGLEKWGRGRPRRWRSSGRRARRSGWRGGCRPRGSSSGSAAVRGSATSSASAGGFGKRCTSRLTHK
jgi:hypothetical protein